MIPFQKFRTILSHSVCIIWHTKCWNLPCFHKSTLRFLYLHKSTFVDMITCVFPSLRLGSSQVMIEKSRAWTMQRETAFPAGKYCVFYTTLILKATSKMCSTGNLQPWIIQWYRNQFESFQPLFLVIIRLPKFWIQLSRRKSIPSWWISCSYYQ